MFDQIANALAASALDQHLLPVNLQLPPSGGSFEKFDPVFEDWENHEAPAAVVLSSGNTLLSNRIEKACRGRSILIHAVSVPEQTRRWHSVRQNHLDITELALSHLTQRGHRRIGFVTHARHLSDLEPMHHRKIGVGHTPWILGLGQGLRQRGIRGGTKNPDSGLTVFYQRTVDDRPGSNPFAEIELERAAAWLSQPNRPTAIIGADFRLKAIVMAARMVDLEWGKDFELLGIGNTPWAYSYGFDSLSYRPIETAQAIMRIIKRYQSKQPPAPSATAERVFIEPELVIHTV